MPCQLLKPGLIRPGRAVWPTAVLALIAYLAVALTPQSAQAQALYAEPAQFTLRQACDITASLRGGRVLKHLEAGVSVEVLGENRSQGGTHAYLAQDGRRGWLALSCGGFAGDRPAFRAGAADTALPPAGRPGSGAAAAVCPGLPGSAQTCLPFFDTSKDTVQVGVGGVVDITPPAPVLDAFDRAVVQLCGAPGSATTSDGFKAMLRAHPQVLSAVMSFTGGKVYAGRPAQSEPARYLDDLAEAWYAVRAFDHVFCGETGTADQKLGGLHFVGRYVQLQASGEACRIPNYKRNEVVTGSVYSMGARMKTPEGGWSCHEIKGYGLTLSATDMLKVATRAMVDNPTTSTDSTACLLSVRDDQQRYTMVFVRRAAGLRTLYPDATPDKGKAKACRLAVRLGSGVF